MKRYRDSWLERTLDAMFEWTDEHLLVMNTIAAALSGAAIVLSIYVLVTQ